MKKTSVAILLILLLVVNLGMNRKIYLNQKSSVFKVVEEITNYNEGPTAKAARNDHSKLGLKN